MGALSALKKAKPLVSKFDEALANIQRPKGTGNEFLTEVMKQAGVKKAEVEDRKLRQAFEKAGKITKAEAQAIARKNASPKIDERILTEQGEKFSELEKMAERDYGEAFEDLHPSIQDEIEKEFDAAAAQYGEYRLPGGSNYREMLLKLPSMPDAEKERLMTLEAKHRRLSEPAQWVFEDSAEGKEMKALKDKAQQSAYYSSHWGKDEPNVLAHMRVQDRVGPNGEKILHVEEIQSDWHQAGRKHGYKGQHTGEMAEYQKLLKEFESGANWDEAKYEKFYELQDKLGGGVGAESQSQIPDAPFKKNWHELAMKRLINHASENGYDKIAITPGAEQASRYSLSNKVNQVEVYKLDNGMYNLEVIGKDGKSISIPDSRSVSPDRISEIVGKDVAERAIGQADQAGNSVLSGLDLEIGGEGMKGFYDKMLPDYLNTLGKKYGAQVGTQDFDFGGYKVNRDSGELPYRLETESSPDILSRYATAEEAWLEAEKRGSKPLHTFDITPELREEITTKGLPLYQQIGMPLGAGAAANELELPEPEYAEGGAVNFNTTPDMHDGGAIIQGAPFKRGGKVKITDNLDEMFMEVNNKKFQRK